MRLVKRGLLGSAAGIFAVAGAQAADLPVKAPAAAPVEYVRVCSLYGAGFWYIPGTDTCMKVGLFTKIDMHYGGNSNGGAFGYGSNPNTGDPAGQLTRSGTSDFGILTRGQVSFDFRTQTEYGTLRQFADMGSTYASSNFGGNATAAETAFYVDRAFIQFAGITAGQMRSFYDIFFSGAYGLIMGHVSHDTAPSGVIGIAYTWQLGGGFSFSASLEDGGETNGGRGHSASNLSYNTGNAAIGFTPAFDLAAGVTDNGGVNFYDPIANIRLDQEWGYAAISGAAHQVKGGYYTAGVPSVGVTGPCLNGFTSATPGSGLTAASGLEQTSLATVCGHPSDAWGFAVNGGFTIVNFAGMRGDSLGAQATFSKGAVGYSIGAAPDLIYGAGNKISTGAVVDGVFTNGSNISLTQVISFDTAYEHIFSPNWRGSVEGGMFFVNYGDGAKSLICPNGASSTPVGFVFTNLAGSSYNCNPDYSYSQFQIKLAWQPVPDIDIWWGAGWEHLTSAFGGSTVTLPSNGARPSGIYTVGNNDQFIAGFRIQRFFLY